MKGHPDSDHGGGARPSASRSPRGTPGTGRTFVNSTDPQDDGLDAWFVRAFKITNGMEP